MSNRRLISSDLYEDEFIGSLDIFSRFLWVGIITACADDQGRLLANPSVIRAKIFPFDDYTTKQIEVALQPFIDAGKLYAYEARGKHLYQVVNWWKHQAPSWASPSKYPPPPEWIDRTKYHAVGNKVLVDHWNEKWILPSYLHSDPPSTINESEGEDKSEDEGEGEGGKIPAEPSPPDPIPLQLRSAIAFDLINKTTGWPAIPPSWKDDTLATIEAIYYQRKDTAIRDMQTAFDEWKRRGYNATNPAWVEWVIGGIPVERQNRRNGKKTLQEDLQSLQNLIDEEATNVKH